MATKTCTQHTTIPFNEEQFSSLIAHAGFLLGLTTEEIKKEYFYYSVFVSTQYEEGEETLSVEIIFDEEQANLTCLFNTETNVCDFVIIYFDAPITPAHYIDYLNSTYTYNHLNCCWNTPNETITVKRNEQGACFCVHRLYDL